jgi:hypothetical protein
MRESYKFCFEYFKRGDHLGDLGIDGRYVILKFILKCDVKG